MLVFDVSYRDRGTAGRGGFFAGKLVAKSVDLSPKLQVLIQGLLEVGFDGLDIATGEVT